MLNEYEQLENICEDVNFYTYGTMEIFKNKESFYSSLIKINLMISFATPLIYLSLYLTKGNVTEKTESNLLIFASIITILQFVSSLLSIILKWDDKKINSKIAHLKNLEINQKIKNIVDMKDFVSEKENILTLKRLYDIQEQSDNQVSEITKYDKRIAMSHTLYDFRLPCDVCGLNPERKKPYRFFNICETCGQKRKR